MWIPLSGPALIFVGRATGLLGLLAWTVGLASVLTAAYFTAKAWLRRSPAVGASGHEPDQDPSQVRVFGLFLLIAILVFTLLLATHFVPAT